MHLDIRGLVSMFWRCFAHIAGLSQGGKKKKKKKQDVSEGGRVRDTLHTSCQASHLQLPAGDFCLC